MKTLELVLAAACGALVALAFSSATVEAQDRPGRDFLKAKDVTEKGVVAAGKVKATFRMYDRLSRDGVPNHLTEIRQRRDVLLVPEHFGELVNITSDGGTTAFWYQDSAGVLRNAIASTPSGRLVNVMRQATDRLDLDYR